MNPESQFGDHILFCRETVAFNSGLFPLLPDLAFLVTSSAVQKVRPFHSWPGNYLSFSGCFFETDSHVAQVGPQITKKL